MSKRKGNNAFYFFMLDWADRQTPNSNKGVSKNLKQIAADPRCNEEWKNLSPQEKGYYQAKAKQSRIEAQGSKSKKTVLGENVSDVEASEKQHEEFQRNMFRYIESVVSMGIKHNNLQKIKFIFIHVNWFYRREIGINKYEFCPAEFAVGEFSLENGMENIYHEVLNVKIPLGWKRDAIETSQQTHQIPIELEEGQSDFSFMSSNLIRLLEANQTGNRFPPLFTTKNFTPAVETLLTKMAAASNRSIDDFLIYSIEALFGALRNAAVQNISDSDCSIPLVVAEYEFGKDVLASTSGFECNFHKAIDGSTQYCSKSIIKRWGFTMCDYCCEYLGIQLIEGIHCPIKKPFFDEYTTDQDDSNINIDMKRLNINDQATVVEMTGVTENHRRKVSERTFLQEQRRRKECKSLDIIDYTENCILNSSNSINNMPARPLRAPKKMPQTFNGSVENNNPFSISDFSLNDTDFPSIERKGVQPKKKSANIKLPLGRGHTTK